MLDADRIFHVVRPNAPAGQRARIVGRRLNQLPEVRVGRRPELVELHGAIRIEDREIAVQVGPGSGIGTADRVLRVERSGGRDVLAVHVAGDARLHRRPAGAEEVVRDADSGADVLPVVRFETCEMCGWIPQAGGQILIEHPLPVPVVADAGVDRRPLDRPVILRVQADVALQGFALVAARAQGDRLRARRRPARRVQRADRHRQVAGELFDRSARTFTERAAELEGVRAGDVGRRTHVGAENGEMIRRRVPGVEDLAVGLLGKRVHLRRGDGSGIPDLVIETGHRGLIQLGVLLVVHREADVEQQLVRLRARPLAHGDEAGRRHLNAGRFRRHERADAPVIPVLVLIIVIVGDLVLVADLPRHAPRAAHDMSVVDAGPRRVRDVPERRRTERVEEAVSGRLVDAPVTEGALPPDFVLDDRSTDRGIEVPDFVDDADVRETVRRVEGEIAGKVAPQVVALPVAGRVVADDHTAKRVAAVARNHVDADAALRHFGGVGARHIADLLPAAVVPVDAAVRAVRAEVVEAHPLDRLHRVVGAFVIQW